MPPLTHAVGYALGDLLMSKYYHTVNTQHTHYIHMIHTYTNTHTVGYALGDSLMSQYFNEIKDSPHCKNGDKCTVQALPSPCSGAGLGSSECENIPNMYDMPPGGFLV